MTAKRKPDAMASVTPSARDREMALQLHNDLDSDDVSPGWTGNESSEDLIAAALAQARAEGAAEAREELYAHFIGDKCELAWYEAQERDRAFEHEQQTGQPPDDRNEQ